MSNSEISAEREQLKQYINLIKNKQFELAMSGLKEYLQEFPTNEVARGMLASLYFQIGMHDRAIPEFETILEQNPDNALARFQLGMTRYTRGELEKSIDCWLPLTEVEDDFMGSFHSALAYVDLQQAPMARPLVEKCVKVMPKNHPLYPRLLQLREELGLLNNERGE